MIKCLSIQNIAIAENLCIEFEDGLNVVTGETGAGKSLLVDALVLLRGAKVDIDLIRTGCDTAQVTGVFAWTGNSSLLDLLRNSSIIDEENPSLDEIFLRRVIQRNGKHRAFINDIPVSTKTLQSIAEELIDISSQFENQRLLNPVAHTYYLDMYANTEKLASKVSHDFEALNAHIKKLFEIENEISLQKREKDLCEFELTEINDADLSAQELENIENILSIGKKAGTAQQLCDEAHDLLSGNDQCCKSFLKSARKNVERLEKLLASFKSSITVQNIDEAIAAIENLSEKIEKTRNGLLINEEEISFATERIEIYHKLFRKFGSSLEQVFNHRDKCHNFLSKVTSFEEEKDKITKVIRISLEALISEAEKLSGLRRDSLNKLCMAVEKELAALGMNKARFTCKCVDNPRRNLALPESLKDNTMLSLLNKFETLSKNGKEEIRFLLSANAGMEPMPLEKIASGGELSRIMLAIKTILFADDSMSLFVFDEIDTGISGNIAARVGQKLANFCLDRQAICITHLAQVACYATSHLVARKITKNQKVFAEIKSLSSNQRAMELANLLSGESVTQESLAHGKSLLSEANRYLQKLKAPERER